MKRIAIELCVVFYVGLIVPTVCGSELFVGGESESNGLNVVISAFDGFADRVEVYVCSDLTSNNWHIAAQNLRPTGDSSARWYADITNDTGFFVVGNMDVDDDADGLPDAREKYVHKTRPDSADSDDDGMPDGWEIQHGFDPSGYGHQTEALEDADGDGLLNIEELQAGTNPQGNDTDGDGFQDASDYRVLITDYPIFGEGIFFPVSTKTVHSTASVATKLTITWGDSFWYPYPKDLPFVSAGSASATPHGVSNGVIEWSRWGGWESETGDVLSPAMEWILSAAANGIYRNLTHEHQIEEEIGYDIYMADTMGYTNQIGSWVITNAMCLVMSSEYETANVTHTETDGPRARGYEDIYAYDGRSEIFKFVFNRSVTNRTVKWMTYQFDYYENERYGYGVHSCIVNGVDSEEFELLSGFVTIPTLELNGDFNLDQTVDTSDTALRADPNASLFLSVLPEIPDTSSNAVVFTLDFPRQYTLPPGDLTLSLTGVEPGERFRIWSTNDASAQPEPMMSVMAIGGGGSDPELLIDPPILFDTDETTEYWWPISDRYEYTEFPKTLYIKCLACSATNDGLAQIELLYEYQNEEICSARLPVRVIRPALVPDWNHDRSINAFDENQITASNPFRFWINDDADNGDISEGDSDVPGHSGGLFGDANYKDNQVNGRSDLPDFFPVWLDIKSALECYPVTNGAVYKLRQADGALKFVYTDLTNTNAGDYLITDVGSCGFNFNQNAYEADTIQITSNGIALNTNFLNRIASDPDKGVLMMEATASSTAPLVLEVWQGDSKVWETSLGLSLSGVEEMYRHLNLRPDNDGHATSNGVPVNYPDELCNSTNVFFLHGFNVSGKAAREWNAEMFKRLYQSGSNAKFWGVTWEGDLGLVNALHYQEDVANCFLVASNLCNEISTIPNKVMLAHSLGNMVVSAAIADYGLSVNKYLMLNAAVAIEVYDAAEFRADTNGNYMVHEDWLGYSNKTWCSTWHELFSTNDARNHLTWKDRFPSVLNVAYNFYSSGDEIFEIKDETPGVLSGGLFHLERYAWQKQETLKGRFGLGSTDEAGWGFSGEYTQDEADAALPDNLRTNAVFRQKPIEMFASNIVKQTQNEILALGVPALSGALGRNEVRIPGWTKNYDMNANRGEGWPRDSGDYADRWLHSDLKNMAYLYAYKLFDELISKGGLE